MAVPPTSQAILMAYIGTLKNSTLHTYEKCLGIVTDLCLPRMETSQATPEELKIRLLSFDWTQVDLLFVSRIHRLAQDQKYSRATLSGLLAVCRGIAKARWALNQITYDEYARIAEVRKHTRQRGKSEEKNRIIPFEDLIQMLQTCLADEKCKRGMRDFALLSLLYGTGLRSREAVNLRLNQIDFEQEMITLVSNGKHERRVWAVEGVMTALRRWLEYHIPVDGVIFPAFSPMTDKPIQDRAHMPISSNALYDILKARALAAGVQIPSPLSFRHSFATKTYEQTNDIFALELQLGHKDSKTTGGYIAEKQKELSKRKAAKSWSLPEWQGRDLIMIK